YRSLRAGETARISDELFHRKDGTVFPVEYISTPMFEDGQVAGAVLTFLDITDRKRAEDELRTSEENYRRLVDDLPEAVVIAKGEVWKYVNESAVKMLGAQSRQEVLNRTIYETVHPDFHDNVRLRIQETDA